MLAGRCCVDDRGRGNADGTDLTAAVWTSRSAADDFWRLAGPSSVTIASGSRALFLAEAPCWALDAVALVLVVGFIGAISSVGPFQSVG